MSMAAKASNAKGFLGLLPAPKSRWRLDLVSARSAFLSLKMFTIIEGKNTLHGVLSVSDPNGNFWVEFSKDSHV